ncbi:MAG: NAD(P)H-hydrate dehydratase [Clostridia bacterium]|nr:NAD(P)H-hydrate dehydratase [Clostridia bacterium]
MEFYVENKDVAKLFLPRQKDSHKGTFGTLVIICGCERYAGAPYLASLGASALRTGTGIVKIAVPRFLTSALQHRVTECTIFPLHDKDGYICLDQKQFAELTHKTTAIICGMGIGDVPQTRQIVEFLIDNAECPLLFDADALNAISKDVSLLCNHKQPVILTPHIGEMARLTGLDTRYIKQNKQKVALEFAQKYKVVLHLKDSESITTDGTDVAINTSGTPAMAKGGSGDLLAGIIGGLLARGIKPFEATFAGAYVAGRSAEKAVNQTNEYSLLPSETATFVSQVVTEIIKTK